MSLPKQYTGRNVAGVSMAGTMHDGMQVWPGGRKVRNGPGMGQEQAKEGMEQEGQAQETVSPKSMTGVRREREDV